MDLPLPNHGSEYYDAIDEIALVLQSHFSSLEMPALREKAHHLAAAYKAFVEDFWGREEATIALENLSRALVQLSNSYEALPQLLKSNLVPYARGFDHCGKETFLTDNEPDPTSQPFSKLSEATEAAEALETLCTNNEDLVSMVDIVRKKLPKGMKTRNRPGNAYAVIHATVEVFGGDGGINIPKAVDQAGPLYRLLTDLFKLFKITNSVSGAFRGWKQNVDGNYENEELLPI